MQTKPDLGTMDRLYLKMKEFFSRHSQLQYIFWDAKKKELRVLQGPNQEIFNLMSTGELEERARTKDDLPREAQALKNDMTYLTGMLEVIEGLGWASWARPKDE